MPLLISSLFKDPVVSINMRYRDIGRKYLSGSKKRVVAKVKKVEAKKEKGSLNKYFRKTISENAETQVEPQHSEDDGREGNKSEEVTLGNQSSYPLTESAMSHLGKLDNNNQVYSSVDITAGTSEVRETGNLKLACPLELTDDPATWPEMMSQSVRDYLVQNGPPSITVEIFPKNESGAHFSKFHCKRKLPNGEIVDRPWLLYSATSDKVFCYYCKLFKNSVSALTSNGFNDWPNIHTRLAEHEKSKRHLQAMLSCCELQQTLSSGKSINEVLEKQIRQEANRWHKVFERLVATVQFLAERNLPFRGSEEHIGTPHNGNFLGVVEFLGKFDPIMQDHLEKILNKEIQDHYLGKNIQNDLINIMGQAVQQEIVSRIKAAKYFSVILDCTPDVSHQEQMSLIIRYVALMVCIQKLQQEYMNIS
ncbi:Zinc finger MYM-type protein 5 [Araneus ventricosus]|uniref:Zinc finger MYM-type protein 5 n=1 Tax=Araneus ventricosus TaxID=182803 RepID=A0A4Y2CB83_ARAVE|nr:Zinc finger MYM-type protein 5 [Araneus ventricosus]